MRTAQLQLEAERTQNCRLQEQNTILEANKPRRSNKSNVPEELAAYGEEIKVLAKKYGVMVEMFFPTSAISQPIPVPAPPFQTADRYASTLAEEQCLVAELDSILPEHIRRVQPFNYFADIVRRYLLFYVFGSDDFKSEKVMTTGRSDILRKLRDNTMEIFNKDKDRNLEKNYFNPNYEHLKVLEICAMLGIKDPNQPKYSLWYPFLFKDMKVDLAKPFTNWEPLGRVRCIN